MKENMKKWLRYIDNNMQLADELLSEKLKYSQQKKSYEEFLKEKFIPEAKNHGFDFSLEELYNFVEQYGIEELTIEELENVSGGKLNAFANIGLGIFSLSLLSAMPTMITQAEGKGNFTGQLVNEVEKDDEISAEAPIVDSVADRVDDEDTSEVGFEEDETVEEPIVVPIAGRMNFGIASEMTSKVTSSEDVFVGTPVPARSSSILPEMLSEKEEFNDTSDRRAEYDDDFDAMSKVKASDAIDEEKLEDLIGFYGRMLAHDDDFDAGEFQELILDMNKCIVKEPALVTAPEGDALIIGDLHGNMASTNEFVLAARLALIRGEVSSVVFLGDYIDRGKYSVEVLKALFDLKSDFPDRVFLIRGNHETRTVSPQNLPSSLKSKFPEKSLVFESNLYEELFPKLPLAVEIPFKNGEKVLCVHGGIPIIVEDVSEEDIENAFKAMRGTNASRLFESYKNVFYQIMWNDPSVPANKDNPGRRTQFSEEQLISFLRKFEYRSLIRGHEFTDGMRKDFDGKCYTVFSSHNYWEQNDAYIAIATPLGVFDYMKFAEGQDSTFMYGNKKNMKCFDVLFEFFNSCDSKISSLKFILGVLNRYGIGTDVDEIKALTYYRELADSDIFEVNVELLSLLKDLIENYDELKAQDMDESCKIEELKKEYLNLYTKSEHKKSEDERYYVIEEFKLDEK